MEMPMRTATRRQGADSLGIPEHWEDGEPDHVKRVARSLRKGAKVLDLGCGSGRDSLYLADRGLSVWAIDRSEPAIRRALAKPRRKNVHFLLGEAEKLPLSSGSFDGVYSRYALGRAPLNAASAEIFRVLKGGGTAYLQFILNMTTTLTGDIIQFLREDEILSAFGGFRVLSRRGFQIFDAVGEASHGHDCFSLVLKKPTDSAAAPSV
jgi:ubiquinone/menaquinone biosynthesis C-methylase UbiE